MCLQFVVVLYCALSKCISADSNFSCKHPKLAFMHVCVQIFQVHSTRLDMKRELLFCEPDRFVGALC
jgi:hypothetical protein